MLRGLLQRFWRRVPAASGLVSRGAAALGDHHPAEAEGHFSAALALESGHPAALAGLARCRAELGDPGGALDLYARSLAADPANADVRAARAGVLRRCGDRPAARQELERALEDDPLCGAARSALLLLLRDECDWPAAGRLWEATAALRKETPPATWLGLLNPYESLLFPCTPGERLAIAAQRAAGLAGAVRGATTAWRVPDRNDRVRVGYLSGDFRDHPVGHLVPGLFEHHDRARFEVFGYSFGADDGSVFRRRVAAACDHFADVREESAAATAARIAADRIDVLVDLAGHTTGNRLAVLAARPAPVQVHYLGFPGTTGAPFVDYFITDRVVSQPGQDACFSEKLVRLPATFMVGDPRAAVDGGDRAVLRAAERLPPGAFVFCCFNRNAKITSEVFAAWMEILRAVPSGVLWLKLDSEGSMRRLQAEAARLGVAGDRLVFAADLADKQAHLGRHAAADLFLDTFGYYNAHTTASDALWAGLPVLTCTSDAFPGRVAGSLLAAAGQADLVTDAPGRFVAEAVRIAATPGEAERLRVRLAGARASARFFDPRAVVADLEAAYRAMIDRARHGAPPEAIGIP